MHKYQITNPHLSPPLRHSNTHYHLPFPVPSTVNPINMPPHSAQHRATPNSNPQLNHNMSSFLPNLHQKQGTLLLFYGGDEAMCTLDPTWGHQPRKTRDPKHTSTSDEQWTYINWIGTRHILRFLFSFPHNIMADVASKQQTAHNSPVLPPTVTHTRRHTELTNLKGNLCCVWEHSIQFFVQFLTSWTEQFDLQFLGPWGLTGFSHVMMLVAIIWLLFRDADSWLHCLFLLNPL
jgi:hypothetical protein